ncbi:hypothetical protein Ancab_005256 [Ancistrocladus abbreviatus]
MTEPDGRTQQIRVFLNHRGEDTKNNFSILLYNRLKEEGINTFFDIESMKPSQDLVDRIVRGIHECKVGVVVFSPHYCDSKSCLRELAQMVECKKRIIPIFWDVQPKDLRVWWWRFSKEDRKNFRPALKAARRTVGLVFDSKGNWQKYLDTATVAIVEALKEVEAGVGPKTSFIHRMLSHMKGKWGIYIGCICVNNPKVRP